MDLAAHGSLLNTLKRAQSAGPEPAAARSGLGCFWLLSHSGGWEPLQGLRAWGWAVLESQGNGQSPGISEKLLVGQLLETAAKRPRPPLSGVCTNPQAFREGTDENPAQAGTCREEGPQVSGDDTVRVSRCPDSPVRAALGPGFPSLSSTLPPHSKDSGLTVCCSG